jgi:prepilin-type N-terminal cleavage/methylation domain-containing protein
MKYASIGLRVGSRSCSDRVTSRRGFTLLEALVALALILSFAATLSPFLFQARRLVIGADGRVAALALLRTLMERPVDRRSPDSASSIGETAGLRWSVRTEPIAIDSIPADAAQGTGSDAPAKWSTFRLVGTVSWAPGYSVQAETVRLFKGE